MTIFVRVTLVRPPIWLAEFSSASVSQKKYLSRRHASSIISVAKLLVPSTYRGATAPEQRQVLQDRLIQLPEYRTLPHGFQLFFEQTTKDKYNCFRRNLEVFSR